jgi:hypothetical protein
MASKRKSTGPLKPVAEKPIALTLKIGHEMFMRLSALRARERTTAQEILTEALEAHLKKAGV